MMIAQINAKKKFARFSLKAQHAHICNLNFLIVHYSLDSMIVLLNMVQKLS